MNPRADKARGTRSDRDHRRVRHRTTVRVAVCAILAMVVSAPSHAGQRDEVVATVGKRRITEHEVDAKIKSRMASIRSQIYELKKTAIEDIADEYLLERAAKRKGLGVEDYLQRELQSDGKVGVSEREARQYYDQHKKQIRLPYDKIKKELADLLSRRRAGQARERLLKNLRAETPVRIALAPPRFEVSTDGHPALGPAGAPVTIVEFGDFQCPFCRRSHKTLREIRAKYGNKVRLVYKDFPLSFHKHAFDAASAARCAQAQAKFWAYHDALFAAPTKLGNKDLKELAKKVGLDQGRFERCLGEGKYDAEIKRDIAEGQRLGVSGTPTFFIEGRRLVGAQPFSSFQRIIDEELAAASDGKAGRR